VLSLCLVIIVNLIVMNVYMPYEDSDRNIDEYMYLLSLIEDVITSNADISLSVVTFM